MVLSSENLIKSRNIDYKLVLPSDGYTSDEGEKLAGLNTAFSLNCGFSQQFKTPSSNLDFIKKSLAGQNKASFSYNSINERRAKLG